jgi:heme exporter protein CcmD
MLPGRPRLSADPNFGFVMAAYVVGFLVLGGMIVAVVADYLALKRALKKFSARSDPREPD